ncbi:MAG: linear amide C-N hydrolase, partial [bacterium]|nr:linear amide C-N hydrolase [bacterium]
IAATQWTSVADSTHRIYFFERQLSPNIVWIKLDELDFKKGASILKFDLAKNLDQVGDVTGDFKPASPFQFLSP